MRDSTRARYEYPGQGTADMSIVGTTAAEGMRSKEGPGVCARGNMPTFFLSYTLLGIRLSGREGETDYFTTYAILLWEGRSELAALR